jgi:1,2-diacylglycerol 3-alpha-glucosyltransferase
MAMKVGILTNTYPPMKNGVCMAICGLEKSLKAKGIEVYIATPRLEGVEYPDNVFAMRCAKVPDKISGDLKLPTGYFKDVKKYFMEKQIDILHTHDTIFGGIEGDYIAEDLGIPCIHTFHTMIEQYSQFRFPYYHSIIQRGIYEVCNGADHIIAPSNKVYEYLLDLGIRTPITQMYNVPYLATIEFEKPNNDFKGLIDTGDFVFLSFCRLSPEKNVESGIQIMEPILKSNPKVKFVIAGDGPQKVELEQLCISKKIDKQVIFVGRYSPEDLQNIITNTNSKAFLFSSESENLPTNILEAMFLGLPVLAIDDESVDYLLDDGINGFKQSKKVLSQYCQKIIDDKELLVRLSNNAKETADQFIAQDIGQKHVNLYQTVLDNYQGYDKVTKMLLISRHNPISPFQFPVKKKFNAFMEYMYKVLDF